MEDDVGHPLALFVPGAAFPIMFQGIAHEAVIGNMIGKGGFAWGIVGWILSALWGGGFHPLLIREHAHTLYVHRKRSPVRLL